MGWNLFFAGSLLAVEMKPDSLLAIPISGGTLRKMRVTTTTLFVSSGFGIMLFDVNRSDDSYRNECSYIMSLVLLFIEHKGIARLRHPVSTHRCNASWIIPIVDLLSLLQH